jgi:hypothetical protein
VKAAKGATLDMILRDALKSVDARCRFAPVLEPRSLKLALTGIP